MKDFMGTELAVGDAVAYVDSYWHILGAGTIIKFNKTGVTVQPLKSKGKIPRPFNKVVKISNELAVVYALKQ